jgi:23S rRNA pseudouridine1911/1915/1917 synthase
VPYLEPVAFAYPGVRLNSDPDRYPEERVETVLTFVVPPGYRHAERLDVYLTQMIANATRSKVQKGVREGLVTVNGQVASRPSQVLQAGDIIVCTLLRPPPIEAAPEDIPLDIVHEDEHLLIIDKPAGMVVHPAYGNRAGTIVNAVLHHVGAGAVRLDEKDGVVEDSLDVDEEPGLSTINALPAAAGDPAIRPGIVHRLDKDTSGLMVVAKNNATHAGLARQFGERTIDRAYLAIVWGVPSTSSGRIEAPLGRDPRDRKRMAVVAGERGKYAATNFVVEEDLGGLALVRFRLETGRTHQIRVHSRHMGHPILGDTTYGGAQIVFGPSTASRRAFFANLFARLSRQALHAATLGFTHPMTGERLFFSSQLPADMRWVLERLRTVELASGGQ